MAASCSLLAAAAGCNLHRTGHGYILRSQWSVECGDMGYIPASNMASQCENADCATCPAEPAKPEVLPWRTRLKTRIGDRLFHRGEFADEQCPDAAAGQPLQSAPLPVATPTVPRKPVIIERPVTPDKLMDPEKPAASEKPVVPEQPPVPVPVPEATPSPVKTTALEMPSASLMEPESKHPDVVME